MAVDTSSPKTEMIDPALLEGVSANFIVKAPSGLEKAYPMRQMTLTIGRSDQCDISVKDSSMSGRHAEIKKSDGDITIRDLGSANGIYLTGERIEQAELFDGDVLRLGQTSIRIDVVGGRARFSGGPRLPTLPPGGARIPLAPSPWRLPESSCSLRSGWESELRCARSSSIGATCERSPPSSQPPARASGPSP